jgi:adenylate cyclase
LRHVLLAVGVGLAGAALSVTEWAHRAEETYGLLTLFTLRGPRPAPEGVEIVALDEASLARFRDLPADPAAWPEPLAGCQRRHGGLEALRGIRSLDRVPRALHACLVDVLAERGAAVIAFDIAFTDDPNRAPGTSALARAIAAHGRVVLLTRARRHWLQQPEGPERPRDELASIHPELAAAALATGPFTLPRTGPRVHQFWTRHPALAEPIQLPVRVLEARALPVLEELARRAGWPDPPAEVAPAVRTEARVTAFLGTEPERWRPLVADPAERAVLEALRRARLGPDQAWFDLYGPPGTIPHRPIADLLLAGERPPEPFAPGTVVFVGPLDIRTTLAADSFPTVFSDRRGIDTAGVELAATAYANLRDDHTLAVPSELARSLIVFGFGSLATLLVLRGTVLRGVATALALALAHAGTAVAAFIGARLWLPLVLPLAVLLPFALLLGQLARYLGLARWLGIYTPRPVAAELLRGRTDPNHVAGLSPVTVMFTDIVGSTALAESLDPATFKDRVDAHFTLVTRAVEATGGEVVEFLGDGLMAYWGGPRGPRDHAARACRAALAIAAALARDNRARAPTGEPPIRLRIGINSGDAAVGNVGAPERGIFTVTGDAANAAQRIEQLARTLCPDRPTAAVLVGEGTVREAGPDFVFEAAGEFELRGRARRERVFRLIGEHTVADLLPGEIVDKIGKG